MNKIFFTSIFLILITFGINNTNAVEVEFESVENSQIEQELQEEIKTWEAIIFLASFFENTPSSYKYITLNFKWVDDFNVQDALKKLVYHDRFWNLKWYINTDRKMNAFLFYHMSKNVLWINIEIDKQLLKDKKVTKEDLVFIKNTYRYLLEQQNEYLNNQNFNALGSKKEIFDDVYNTIINNHYKNKEIDREDLINWAIQGLASWTNDPHTVYFPPIENKSFWENLEWEYEWIWAYVEMAKPWVVRITTPVPGGPAQKSWIKWWDLIKKVDSREVKEENSLQEVTSWIKWEEWTFVNLTIERNWEILNIDVKREKITIKNLETKKINNNTFYINIKSFWSSISSDFRTALEELKEENNTSKLIIDLRNNWGWYLDQVIDMMSFVVEEWKKIATVKYEDFSRVYESTGEDLIDFSNYEIIVLQNSWTASASEIMIWALKDYFNVTTIWEKTYGKWSVQTIREYSDWSSFKYTIANWYYGDSETWIDWKWINADFKLELDIEKLNNSWVDNQLQEAINK